MAPSKLGSFSELIAATWLMKQGYEVYRNLSACGKVDLLAERNGELIKIDVKTAHTRKDGSFYRPTSEIKLQNAQNISILFAFPSGDCKWDYEIIPSKPGRPRKINV